MIFQKGISCNVKASEILLRSLSNGPYDRETWVEFLVGEFPREPCRLICDFADLGLSQKEREIIQGRVKAHRRQMHSEKSPYENDERLAHLGKWWYI